MKLDRKQVRGALRAIYENQDRDGLWFFIRDFFKVEVPKKKICTDHDAPFDFVCAVFFQEHEDIIAVANRNGGKTIDFSILDVLNSYLHDNCETATIGAIEMQAAKCYSYVQRWNRRIKIFFDELIASLRSMTSYKNGSTIEILIATISGVNAPHPQKVFIDEVELILWNVLQEAFSMAASKGTIKGQTILTSSRKFAYGPMERLLEESEERGFVVYRWCIMETVEKHDPELCAASKFNQYCKGRCEEVDGYYSFTDTVKKVQKLDQDTFESQWMSWKPMSKGLVYPQFNDLINVVPCPPDLGAELELAEDFGFAEGHADVIGFFQAFGNKKRLIDSIWVEGKTDDEIIFMVEEKLLELGFVPQKYADPDKREEYRYQFNAKVRAWYCPPEEPSKITIRTRNGYRIVVQTDPEIRKVRAGIPLIRKDLADMNLEIDPKNKMIIWEMKKYPNKKRGDGTFLDEPDKKFDNGPDMIRYYYINRFPPYDSGNFKKEPIREHERPATAGIRDARF